MRNLLLIPFGGIAAAIVPFLTLSWFVNAAFQTTFSSRSSGGSTWVSSSFIGSRTNKHIVSFMSNVNDVEGFTKQSGPDGEYYAYDYDKVTTASKVDNDKELLQAELDQRNKARKKFGLKPLTLAQYVALKAQSVEIGKQQIQDATDSAFAKFDANGDGVITLQEFKSGLEGMLQSNDSSLSERALKKIFEYYDTSGDGLLQPDEFVTLDQLRKQMDLVLQEEEIENNYNSNAQQPNNLFQNFMKKITTHLEEGSCQSNSDCYHPEVCCDFGYTKRCCTRSGGGGGGGRKEPQLQYATIPVQQQV